MAMATKAFVFVAFAPPVASMQLRTQSMSAQPAAADDGAGLYRQELHNLGDVQYTGEIVVGGQAMRGILDTGSFELLVLSKDCKVCGNQELLFDHETSSSYAEGQSACQHSFGSGVTFSNEAFDTVRVGPLESKNQRFWEVFDAMMPILEESSFQAIIGVGPPDSAAKLTNDHEGQMSAMEREFKDLGAEVPLRFLSQPASQAPAGPGALKGSDPPALSTKFSVHTFSVCIAQVSGAPGYFIWNDKVPEDMPAEQGPIFTHVPVSGEIHWAAQMTDVRIGKGRYGDASVVSLGCDGGCAAVVDSGTSLIAAPPEVISKVDEALVNLKQDCSNLGDMPDLVFNLGGHEFSLPPDAYIGQVVQNGAPNVRDILHFRFRSRHFKCVPLFMDIATDTQLGPMWILGLPFFRKYYTTFSHDPSSKPIRKHMAMALADDRCYPMSGDSLLGSPRSQIRPRTVELSHLRVPRWAEDAMNRTHITV